MKNKKYIPLVIIVLIFAVWFIPRINNRIKSDKIIESNRTEKITQSSKLSFVLGIDLYGENIMNPTDGACVRYLN